MIITARMDVSELGTAEARPWIYRGQYAVTFAGGDVTVTGMTEAQAREFAAAINTVTAAEERMDIAREYA